MTPTVYINDLLSYCVDKESVPGFTIGAKKIINEPLLIKVSQPTPISSMLFNIVKNNIAYSLKNIQFIPPQSSSALDNLFDDIDIIGAFDTPIGALVFGINLAVTSIAIYEL